MYKNKLASKNVRIKEELYLFIKLTIRSNCRRLYVNKRLPTRTCILNFILYETKN